MPFGHGQKSGYAGKNDWFGIGRPRKRPRNCPGVTKADSGKAGRHDGVEILRDDLKLQPREWPPMEAQRQCPALWAGLFT